MVLAMVLELELELGLEQSSPMMEAIVMAMML